jgi:hypothetical protein
VIELVRAIELVGLAGKAWSAIVRLGWLDPFVLLVRADPLVWRRAIWFGRLYEPFGSIGLVRAIRVVEKGGELIRVDPVCLCLYRAIDRFEGWKSVVLLDCFDGVD